MLKTFQGDVDMMATAWLGAWVEQRFASESGTFRDQVFRLLVDVGNSDPERWSCEGYDQWVDYGLGGERRMRELVEQVIAHGHAKR